VKDDAEFCQIVCPDEDLETLSDAEIGEMAASVIVDFVETKKAHFRDLECCLTAVSSLRSKKQAYKKSFREAWLKATLQKEYMKVQVSIISVSVYGIFRIIISLLSCTKFNPKMQTKSHVNM
jgi:hypothetical protein